MQIHQLRYALKVAELRNFSQAAKALFVTQPTLSQQIQSLEKELGVHLFIRQPRRITLTDAGDEFVVYARRILNDLDNLNRSMEAYAQQEKGRIRVGLLWVFGYLGIAENVCGFERSHPGIEIRIQVDGSAKLMELLLERELDVAYLIANEKQMEHPEISFYKIMESNLEVVIPRENPLAKRRRLTFEDLEGESVILPSRDSSLYTPVMANFHVSAVMPRVVCESSLTDVAMACASGGIGIAFLSANIAQALATSKVVIRPIDPVIKRTIYFAVLRDTQDIPSIRSFTNYVLGCYGSRPSDSTTPEMTER